MAPSYRPSARRHEQMDPATKRLAIFAGVIGTALLGLVAAWSFTGHHRGGIPVVEAPSGPVKVKPANPGGMLVEGANDSILSGEADGKETVAPGPEAPAPQALKAQEDAATQAATPAPPAADTAEPRPLPLLRPHVAARNPGVPAGSSATDGNASVRLIPGAKPPGPLSSAEPRPPGHAPIRLTPMHGAAPALVAQAVTTPSDDQGAAPQVTTPQNAPVQSTPLQPPAGQPPAAQTTPAQPAAPAAQAAPAPAAPAPMAPPAAAAQTAPAGHGKRALVQFAAVDSGEAALREWQRLSKKYPDLFNGHTPNITKTEHNGKTFWRIRTGGFTDLTQAAVFCQKVKARGGACTVATF